MDGLGWVPLALVGGVAAAAGAGWSGAATIGATDDHDHHAVVLRLRVEEALEVDPEGLVHLRSLRLVVARRQLELLVLNNPGVATAAATTTPTTAPATATATASAAPTAPAAIVVLRRLVC
jgi:hypothetical protein